jgi:hypothetical protein
MADERWDALDAAFDKILPKDDAERERLVAMRETMRSHHEEAAKELARSMREMKILSAPSDLGKAAVEQGRIADGVRGVLDSGFREQVELIQRIAGATSRSR